MTRRSILVLCFFPAFDPPASGGELRLLNLYKALSRHVDVTLLTSTDFGARREEIRHTPGFHEIRFPKDRHWRSAYAALERSGLAGELSGLAMALAVSDPACAYTQAAHALAPDADAILHEFPYSEPIFADRRYAAKEVYNAHNFETSLLGAVADGPGFEAALLKLMRLEGNLAARAARVLATSEEDADKFRLFHGVPRARLSLCPNGFDEAELRGVAARRASAAPPPARRPRLLFLGSAHRPNVDAAEALVAMAQHLDACDILLAGSVCGALEGRALPPNVVVFGPIDRAKKLRLLAEVDIFVNPVVTGSGTSLKAIEALGAGLPLLSTPEGVRGLDLAAGVEAAVVDRRDFPDAVLELLASRERTRAMAEAGRRIAGERFTWSGIADGLRAAIDDLAVAAPAAPPARPLVVAFNDYPVRDASSGGQARILNLLGNLDADTVLVTFGLTCDVVRLGPNLIGVLVPKTAEHQAFEAAANAGQPLSVNDCVASLFVGSNRIMRAVASALARRAGAVIFEHSYMAPILDAIDAVRPGLPVIYSAHNVEARHRVHMLGAHSAGAAIGALVCEVERALVARARLVVCCTGADAAHFAAAGAATLTVANGCTPPERHGAVPSLTGNGGAPLRVGFMGSGHGPNVEALRFILDDLAPACPEFRFDIVGGVGEAVGAVTAPNVTLHGVVDDAAKSDLLSGWALALNPVTSGGGSSLKLPDFMAHGLPTINTPTGARGFAVVEHGAGLVVEREGFRAAMKTLLADAARRRRMGERAFDHARRQLSWAALARPYDAALRGLVTPATGDGEASRSLLVVTYRYTEPSLGGAEEYLIEVLKRIRDRFGRIDLAAIDVARITDEHHFACRISGANAGASSRVADLFDRALFFPPEELPRDALIERCRRLERAWMAREFDLVLPFADVLADRGRLWLLSGFYGPEDHGGVLRRWTSPDFSFLLPRGARTMRLVGTGHRPTSLALTSLRLTADASPEIVAEHRQTLSSRFTINVSLPDVGGDAHHIVRCRVDEHGAEEDHRPLGVLLESASALVPRRNGGAPLPAIGLLDEHVADLGADKEREIRTARFEAWVARLDAMARTNPPAVEEDFAAVRGPHAPALQAWLGAHASAYDTVLVQGIPFDVIPRTVETLGRTARRPRIVTLPHFHGDDRFYHWRRYVEAFRGADTTLMFSPAIGDALRLPGKLTVVPGGGVSSEERADLAAGETFRAVHGAEAPFFLVLGRKTASKSYGRIVAAHRALRARGNAVDLVLIGPDEDGLPVSGDGVHSLGRQPRAVVRGALSACAGLVTMSVSESFGIVLCEAWLFGKPVIANRACYAFRDLIRHGETGLLVGTDEDLADAMARVLLDPAAAKAMGRAGRDATLKAWTWDQVSDRIVESLTP